MLTGADVSTTIFFEFRDLCGPRHGLFHDEEAPENTTSEF